MDALPEPLVDPPWEKAARQPKPARPKEPEPRVMHGLEPPSGLAIVWAPGEREKWAATRSHPLWPRTDAADFVQQYLNDPRMYPPSQTTMFPQAPEELVRPLIEGWRLPYVTPSLGSYLRPIVARFELAARSAVLHAATLDTGGCGEALVPFLDAEVVRLMADARFRLKTAQGFTWTYFGQKHGLPAVPFLVPDALGKSRPARRKALAALWLIADEHGGLDEVVKAAGTHGPEAAEALAEALRADRPTPDVAKNPAQGPQKPPKLPWLDAATLPAPVLRATGQELPPTATGNLVSFMALSGTAPSGDLREIFTLFEPASLAAFSWAIFEAWRAAGEPSRNAWVLSQLAWLGDDDTVRRLTPVIRAWPGQAGHAKAVRGLDVLSAIGTDVALIHLNGIAQRVKFTGLKDAARRSITSAAKARGLTAEQLADRLVPDFGLDDEGGLTLDYGPRSFRVAFDEQLKPYVTDTDGKIRKSLPKPAAKDDPEKAPAAYQRYAALKKDVRTIASDQIVRLESAMVTGRRWTPGEFQTYFTGHPLIWHIARRLVWQANDRPFRIAEDRTLSDADDKTFTLPPGAEIGIAHPLTLGEERATWSELFADYEITQPFPQLGRPVHALTDEERTSWRLTRFEGAKVSAYKVVGLTRHGWERGIPQDGGVEQEISLQVAPGKWIVIDLDPGIAVGAIDVLPEQTLRHIMIAKNDTVYQAEKADATFADLTPVTASEVITQLTDLTTQ